LQLWWDYDLFRSKMNELTAKKISYKN
jgi:hypothetical protein